MSPLPIRTTFDVILLALQARVMSVTGWPPERVLIDADDDVGSAEVSHPQADQYVRIRWEDGQFDSGGWEGGGRVDLTEDVRVTAEIWTRLALDDTNSSDLYLTEVTLGHAKARHLVLNALAGFQPTDSNGNWLVIQPIEPKSSRKPRRKRSGDGWGASSLSFSVQYLADLDQTYQ